MSRVEASGASIHDVEDGVGERSARRGVGQSLEGLFGLSCILLAPVPRSVDAAGGGHERDHLVDLLVAGRVALEECLYGCTVFPLQLRQSENEGERDLVLTQVQSGRLTRLVGRPSVVEDIVSNLEG